jgi:hypothetical protein
VVRSKENGAKFIKPHTRVNPTILIATTCRWFPTARLGVALAQAGFAVKAVCPRGHALQGSSAACETHTYRGLAPLTSFTDAIRATNPDLILPGDDLATQHLYALHYRAGDRSEARLIRELIERSLGSPRSFPTAFARTNFMELARQEGVRAPKTAAISNESDLREWVAQAGFPTVLKADRTFGGYGVRVVHTLEEAERAFRILGAPPRVARAAKRFLIDGDAALVWPTLLRRRPVLNGQAFVAGSEATSAVVCWKGTVLASLHFKVLRKAYPTGPATVVRLIDDAEISAATEKMVRRLELSGMHGFDFMLDADTGSAHLIEMNPRATQVGHLALGPGRDLAAALYAAVAGRSLPATPRVTEKDTIALYPQEWIRDPNSPFLRSAYHDVPWEEPSLVRVCAAEYQKQRAWYAQPGWIETTFRVRVPNP